VVAYYRDLYCRHIVAGERRGARENGVVPASGESREFEKMKNSGNEAKKWLKTKDITFFKGAN
jgi:hypothetical protein